MQMDELLGLLDDVRPCGDGYMARCPAHDDRNPSLHIRQEGGKLLLHCFGGCQPEAIVKAVGKEMHDLFTEPRKGARAVTKSKDTPHVVATYSYTDADGKEVYQAWRWEPGLNGGKKSYTLRRPDGNGGYINGIKGVPKVLYRLPEVVKAVRSGARVFIVEGERKADLLASWGLTAACSAMGAGKWEAGYTESLKGAQVFILPDNDEAGALHLQTVGRALHGVAAAVRVVNLPGLPLKGDIVDWVQAGGTRKGFLRLCEQAAEWTPDELGEAERNGQGDKTDMAIPGSGPDGFPLTDLGNAERLGHYYGEDLRYVVDQKKWLVWDGTRWVEDRELRVLEFAKLTVRHIYEEAANERNERKRADTAKWAAASESCARIQAMVNLSTSMLAITTDQLDTERYVLCCRNGILDLRTGELRPPCRDDYMTKLVPVDYDPTAPYGKWENFLNQVMPDDEVRRYLQKAVGYSLSGDVGEQCFFFLFGGGANGKTTFAEVVSALSGDYFWKLRSAGLMLNRNRNSSNEIAELVGRRLVVTSELSSGQAFDEGLIKDLTGGDTVSARQLYERSINFACSCVLWMYGNQRPRVCGKDYGIWRRVRLIEFSVEVPEAEQDKHLTAKLQEELPGILRWAVEGCKLWLSEGLLEPAAVRNAVTEYRHEQDSLARFIADRCVLAPTAKVTKRILWDEYAEWLTVTGEDGCVTFAEFNSEVRTHPGIKGRAGTGGRATWFGIGLRHEN